jgi:hypothetical protein
MGNVCRGYDSASASVRIPTKPNATHVPPKPVDLKPKASEVEKKDTSSDDDDSASVDAQNETQPQNQLTESPSPPKKKVVPFADFKEGEKILVHSILESNVHLKLAAIQLKELCFQTMIGHGAFGDVIQGAYYGTPVIIKRMVRQNIDENNIRIFAEEIQRMMNLRHPNIVQVGSPQMQMILCISIGYRDTRTLT